LRFGLNHRDLLLVVLIDLAFSILVGHVFAVTMAVGHLEGRAACEAFRDLQAAGPLAESTHIAFRGLKFLSMLLASVLP
jgi:hypothetical protein